MIYGENSEFTLVRCKSDEEWQHERTKGIGGSDVAALMGFSPWKTPLQLWLEKTGRQEPEDLSANNYVQFGTIMEPVIGARYKAEHPSMTVKRVNAMCRSKERPWAQASLDYEIKDHLTETWGVLEIKTARNAKDWQDGVPLYYLCQVLHYLSVTGREYGHLCVFFRDTCEFSTYLIRRDEHEDDLQAINEAVDRFWRHYVENDIMPAVSGNDTAALARLYSDASDEIVYTDAESFDEFVEAYKQAQVEEKEAKRKKDYASAVLTELIGNRKGLHSDRFRVTSVRSKRTNLDEKLLKKEHPDIYAQYTSEVFRSGGLRIKEL